MRMVLTTQRKTELLNSDQSLKIFARVIIVGESSSSIIHEEKKNTYESLVSLSTDFNSLITSKKDNSYDVIIIVRPEQFNNFIYENKLNNLPLSTKKKIKRKRYSSSGVGESSDEIISTVPLTTTFYAHRSILSVSLLNI